MKNNICIILVLLLTTTCNFSNSEEKDFYSFSKSGDLWRVPLIEPYEVVSPSNSGSNDWFLIIRNNNIEGPNFYNIDDAFQLSSIKEIGIFDSVIVAKSESVYWPKLSGEYPSTLIIDVKTGKQYLYSDQHHQSELNETLVKLEIEEIKMFKWDKVKNDFIPNMKVPEDWLEQRHVAIKPHRP
jgi:hypothetical protein